MASINCMKCTNGNISGLRVHFDQQERLERSHDNPHIDKSLTHLNSFYGCTGYDDMVKKQQYYLASLDAFYPPKRVKKDRVTAIMMEVPVPKSISDKGLTDQFLADTYDLIGSLLVNKQYMCGMTVHRDEVHDYIDRGGVTKTSLEHGHIMVVPFARWTAKETVYDENGKPMRDEQGKIVKKNITQHGVNAKHFLTRDFLQRLQDEMQDMVKQKYGISYQTGKEPLHMDVEDLKRESDRATAIINRAYAQTADIRDEYAQASEKLRELENTIKEKEQHSADLDKKIKDSEEKSKGLLNSYTTDISKKMEELRQLEDAVRKKQSKVTELEGTIKEKNALVTDMFTKFVQKSEDLKDLENEITKKKQQITDLSKYQKALNSSVDAFFGKIINDFKEGLSEAREMALRGVEPDASTKAMEMIDRAEGRAVKAIDTIKSDKIPFAHEKVEENKSETKETIGEEASAEKEEIRQIPRRRRGR